MRNPKQSKIKEQCKKSIKSLMKTHALGEVKEIRLDTEGWVNPCFFVNDQYVFRFNARDPHLPKYNREKIIFDLLNNSKVPVPQKVILDTSKREIEYDVLISKMLKGENLESKWNNLEDSLKTTLATKAGSILKKLHSIHFEFFGEIPNKGPLPQTSSWSNYLKAKLQFHLDEALELGLIGSDIESKFNDVLSTNTHLLDQVKVASLIHVDFHFGNLLFSNDEITGVVDFEWALAGDPLYDLARWRTGDEDYPGSQEAFFKGYGLQDFTQDEKQRMKIYQMIKNLELCSVAKLHFTEKESEDFLKTTLDQLSSF